MQLNVKNGITCLFILMVFQGFAQKEKINQFDAEGKRDGRWKKEYKNSDQVRYEGTFEHGEEVGTFKFYKPESGDQPAATKTFRANSDTVEMKFFNKKGFLVSEGKQVDKKRVGKWKYYKPNSKYQLVMAEEYKAGKLHGLKTVYFDNGQITEKKHFKNGLKNGEKLVYNKRGNLIQQYNYENDTLQGNSKVYNGRGQLKSEGRYKDGLRDGKWKFYENGKLDSTENYPLERRVKNIPKKKED